MSVAPAGEKIDATMIELGLESDMLAQLDEWIGRQSDPKPDRAEAIRKHVAASLERTTSEIAERPHTKMPGITGSGDEI